MLRRAAAGVILGISLFLASLAWSSFIALRTVFDPNRSQQIADDLWADEAVRAQLSSNIADAVVTLLPDGVEVSPEVVDAAALTVLDSPALRSVVDAAFIQTHAAFLGEADLPRAIEVGEISQSLRDALVALQPELDSSLPAAPDVTIELPTDRVPNAGPVRRALQFIVPILAISAAVGIAVALLTTTNRPAVLRRAGVWALTASAFVLVVSYGVPWLVARLAPDQAEVLAAFVTAILAAALTPSIVLAVLGAAAIGVSLVWRVGQSVSEDRAPRRARGAETSAPAPTPQPAGVPLGWDSGAPEPRAAGGVGLGGTSTTLGMPSATPPAASPTQPVPPAPPATAPIAAPPTTPVTPVPAAVEPQQVTPTPPTPDVPTTAPPPPNPAEISGSAPVGTGPDPTSAHPNGPAPAAAPGVPAPRWMPGIGWVQHPDDERPPESARWEPGIGYVLDGPEDPFAE